ncbi:MAG TPA: DUF2934 domain-containing protein [Bryobacteraceae bacterium]|nr:DUF2934 domain-containing protein [Bryobacteraceae bacterium]
MAKRKPVEAAEALPIPATELKKTVRRAPAKPKSAVHKHHAKNNAEPALEPIATATAPKVTQEAIAQLAYSYWEARGCHGGCPEQDWFKAEQELLKLS